jgi:hypothetical protein
MADEFDPFAPGSNLRDNFDGVTRCVFEKSENSDNYNAHMYILATDGDEVESFLSLGKDWVSYDGGKSVEHPRGEATKFNAQTTYSEFIVFAMGGFDGDKENPDERPAPLEKGLGGAEVMRARNRELNNRGPQVAAIWDDLLWHFDVVKRHGRQRVVSQVDGKERVEWLDIVQERMMPTRFIGVRGHQESFPVDAPPAPAPAPAGAASPSAPVAGVHPALADLDQTDRNALTTLARERSFGDFVDLVMALPSASGGTMLDKPKVIQALSDEGFYNTLRGG